MTSVAPVFDFDDNAEWGPRLTRVLQAHLPPDTAVKISEAKPEYIEDAADIVLRFGDKWAISEAITDWLKSQMICGYHGTRINSEELASILQDGLIPLVAARRSDRLRRALSQHPRWLEVAEDLEAALDLYGVKKYGGGREGQVHLTISRAGLVKGFNHYLAQGSEFDWHVAHHLLGAEGQALISGDGATHLVTVAVPGDVAFAAANPFGKHSEDLPNLVRDVLRVWSFWLGDRTFRAESLKVDCGLIFYEAVPASWIAAIDRID